MENDFAATFSMKRQVLINWILDGDVSVQYQVYRDLLSEQRRDLQDRIAQEGWGATFLSKRNSNGHWGREFYQPKWTSTHYTLLDLRNLCISPDNSLIQDSIAMVLKTCKTQDGGILILRAKKSDVCVNGMFLNYASYFKANEVALRSVVNMLLKEHMPDGGFNCRSNRSKAEHSSFHSTLSVLEGLTEYAKNGYAYRTEEVENAISASKEFLLKHQLFISDRTGKIIDKNFLKLSYPRRWRYDILSALDYLRYSNTEYDERLLPAIDVLMEKRNKDGTWNVQAKLPGQTHLDMEAAGKPSRWNTLRALRVIDYFKVKSSPMTILVFGLPGSGKSYFAERLAEKIDAEYVNSDRLRKELFPRRTYSDHEKATVYDTMLRKLKEANARKRNLVLDATFHKKETRELFIKHTKEKIRFIEVYADQKLIKERLKKSRPYSEADFKVHQLIQQEWEPLVETHLQLESTNDNIDAMLQKALKYLKYD